MKCWQRPKCHSGGTDEIKVQCTNAAEYIEPWNGHQMRHILTGNNFDDILGSEKRYKKEYV